MYKLYHYSTLIGVVTSAEANGMSMHGLIEMTEVAHVFNPVFAFMRNNDATEADEAAIDPDNLEHWYISNEQGERTQIGPPGIFDKDGKKHILWRFL